MEFGHENHESTEVRSGHLLTNTIPPPPQDIPTTECDYLVRHGRALRGHTYQVRERSEVLEGRVAVCCDEFLHKRLREDRERRRDRAVPPRTDVGQ